MNKNKKIFITVDCRGINPNGPGRFRTRAMTLSKPAIAYIENKDKLFSESKLVIWKNKKWCRCY